MVKEEISLTKLKSDLTERYKKCGLMLKSGESEYNKNIIEQLQMVYTFLNAPQTHQFILSQFRFWLDSGLYVACYIVLGKIYKITISMGQNNISKLDELKDFLNIVEQKQW